MPTAIRFALPLAAMVLMSAIVFGIYAKALDSPFFFDDEISVLDNVSIVRLWPLWGDAAHRGPLNPTNHLPVSGRPLVNLSLAVNYYFGRFDPLGYHVFNLIAHLISALLLWRIVTRTLRLDYFANKFDRAAEILGFITALLWALHPLQTEPVIYVTQRTELLVGLFYFATLYASLWYWSARPKTSRRIWLILATLVCLAGMACKEVMATAPLIVLLFERTFIAGSFKKALRDSWRLYVGLCVSWGLLLVLNYNQPRSDSAGFHLGISAHSWWMTQAKVLLIYLKLSIWPWPLTIHYATPYLTNVASAWIWWLPAMLIVIATLFFLWRRPALGFVGAWVLVILSPTLVVPIITEVAAERRMYLPLAALIALIVVGGYFLSKQVKPRVISSIVAAFAVALIWSLISVHRVAAYHDPITLWQETIAVDANDSVAHTNLGALLTKAGRQQEAIAHLNQSLLIKPDSAEAHNNLGIALARTGQSSEALKEFNKALELNPNYAEAYHNVGVALARAGQTSQAIVQFEKALRCNPNYSKAHLDLGSVLKQSGRLTEAIEHFQQAARLRPDMAEAYVNMALTYDQLQQPNDAINAARQALRVAQANGQTLLIRNIQTWLNAHGVGQ
ncbi:MAG TPA: tetratricopeptide repeat protein [Tepidisphaeraceae bacterium]|nr:tetratricopeptide repeat protein [Tepidisphaeraceae bacterium]